jgi:hypothetical protein
MAWLSFAPIMRSSCRLALKGEPMNNVTKWFGGFFLALGLLALSSPAQAVWYKGTPKDVFVSSYTTGPLQITPAVSTAALANNPNAAYMPGALYQVTLSSGAASEFIELFDSTFTITNCALAAGTQIANQNLVTPRLLYGSTTANTVFTFDPPIRFDWGLWMCDSAQTGQAGITYELGRGISGQ